MASRNTAGSLPRYTRRQAKRRIAAQRQATAHIEPSAAGLAKPHIQAPPALPHSAPKLRALPKARKNAARRYFGRNR